MFGNIEIDDGIRELLVRRKNIHTVRTNELSPQSYGALMGYANRQEIELNIIEGV